MNSYRQISPRQWFFLATFATICLTPFGLPSTLYGLWQQGAWVPIVASYLVHIWGLYVAVKICKYFQGLHLAQWSAQVMGRWLGGLYAVLAIAVLYLWGVIMLYFFLDLIIYTQLPYTSRGIILVFILAAVMYLLSRGLEGWARWGELFAFFLFFGLLFTNIPQLFNASWGHLLPFDAAFRDLNMFIRPELIASLFIFRGIFSIYFLNSHIQANPRLFRWSFFALTVAFLVVLAGVVLPMAIFGASFAAQLTYPYQESLGTVALPWLPIERITLLTPMLWQLIIVYVLCTSLYCTMSGIKTMAKVKGNKPLLYGLGAVTLLLTMFPIQQNKVFQVMIIWSFAGLLLFVFIPTILWAVLALRRGRKG